MPKPFLKITRRMGDAPIEATCSECPQQIFFIKGGLLKTREDHERALHFEFEKHVKAKHGAQ